MIVRTRPSSLALRASRNPSWRRSLLALALWATGCGSDPIDPNPQPVEPPTPADLAIVGRGALTNRYTAEVWVHGNYGYTSTWGSRGTPPVTGNAIFIWDVRGSAPQLVDSVIVAPLEPGVAIRTTGDVQVSDDGTLLVFPTELAPGSVEIYSLTDPVRPRLISRFTSPNITRGVHTCELQRIDGRLYAFLSVNSSSTHPSRLMIVDLSDPLAPREVLVRNMGNPFIHDVFVRDGLLFTALWNDGLVIWDIGGGGRGGSLANPIEVGRVVTRDGEVHNAWWFHDPTNGSKRYVFVGQEGSASLFASSSGDIHVVDIANPSSPREVAVFSVPGAGTHNFSVDEARGFLYAAYYNGGVQVLDVRGDLGSCTSAQRTLDGRCDLRLMNRLVATGAISGGASVFVWGVQHVGGAVYASDMLNGLVKLQAAGR